MSPDLTAALQDAAAAAADKKAFEITLLNVEALTSLADGFLICSGASQRQVAAIADAIRERLGTAGRRPLHVEGEGRSEWVLIDYGDLVIHVFTEERRAYYALDRLWAAGEPIQLEEGRAE